MSEIIVCRCEDICQEEIQEAIEIGITSLEELKRYLRVGMGPCQGRTCEPIIRQMLAKALNKKPQDIENWEKRPPLKPVPANVFFTEEIK